MTTTLADKILFGKEFGVLKVKDVKESVDRVKERINKFGYECKFEKLHWSDEIELIKIIDEEFGDLK